MTLHFRDSVLLIFLWFPKKAEPLRVFRGFVPTSSSIVAPGRMRPSDGSLRSPRYSRCRLELPGRRWATGCIRQRWQNWKEYSYLKAREHSLPYHKNVESNFKRISSERHFNDCASSSHWARFPANCAGRVIFYTKSCGHQRGLQTVNQAL